MTSALAFWSRYKLVLLPVSMFLVGVVVIIGVRAFQSPRVSSARYVIALKSNKATPDAISAKVGETVEFATQDGLKHNISEGSGMEGMMGSSAGSHEHEHMTSTLSSGVFGKDQSYQLKLAKAGTYNFYDSLHPDISATIIVYQPTGK